MLEDSLQFNPTRTGQATVPLFQMDIGFESGQKFGKLLDTNELYIDDSGVYCSRCNEWAEYPYDEPHDCIECAGCGEYDMCICEEPK